MLRLEAYPSHEMKTFRPSLISRTASSLAIVLIAFAGFQLTHGTTGPATPALDQFVEKWLTDHKISGVSIGLIKDGTLVLAKGCGLANRETKLTATADTVWSMASCSKPVVGLAALKLVDLGKLDLDKGVSDYLGFVLRNPNFPEDKITMRHLLAHVSSLNDAGQANISNYPRPDPPQQLEKDIRAWLRMPRYLLPDGLLSHRIKLLSKAPIGCSPKAAPAQRDSIGCGRISGCNCALPPTWRLMNHWMGDFLRSPATVH